MITTTQPILMSVLADRFIFFCHSSEMSLETIKTRKSHLKTFLTFSDAQNIHTIDGITLDYLDEYFFHYRLNHKKSTTNTARRIVRAFFIWARDHKEINLRFEPERIKIAKCRNNEPKCIDPSIIRKVISECPDNQDRLIIALFAETGIRASELANMRVGSIDGTIIKIVGKGLKSRKVYITKELASKLRDYIKNRNQDDFVFVNQVHYKGERMRTNSIRFHLKRHFMHISGIDMHPHQLRHSFAMTLLENGCDIVTIKELLGHEDINTTMIYLKLRDEQIQNNHSRYIGNSFLT